MYLWHPASLVYLKGPGEMTERLFAIGKNLDEDWGVIEISIS